MLDKKEIDEYLKFELFDRSRGRPKDSLFKASTRRQRRVPLLSHVQAQFDPGYKMVPICRPQKDKTLGLEQATEL